MKPCLAGIAAAAATILVVDDEVLIRMVIADHLRECGYHVIGASDGQEAIAVLAVEPGIAIIVSDVQMPNCNGFELAQWVHRERPNARVILASGAVKAAEVAVDLCIEYPVLTKPYDLDAIVSRIRSLA